jgi:hypothetical protein
MNEVAVIVVSAMVGAIVSYLGSYWERRAKVDEGLRAARIPPYKTLWAATGRLPMWPRRDDVTYGELHDMSMDLRAWYFAQEGGMFLSSAAREAYEVVQVTIADLLASKTTDGADDAVRITPDEYSTLQKACSALRSQLTRDLLSRRAVSRFA